MVSPCMASVVQTGAVADFLDVSSVTLLPGWFAAMPGSLFRIALRGMMPPIRAVPSGPVPIAWRCVTDLPPPRCWFGRAAAVPTVKIKAGLKVRTKIKGENVICQRIQTGLNSSQSILNSAPPGTHATALRKSSGCQNRHYTAGCGAQA